MAQFEAFDDGVEIHGRAVVTVLDEVLPKFSDHYRSTAIEVLEAQGITDPRPDDWYPQQAWLDALEAVTDDLEPHLLDRLGEQVPNLPGFAGESETVEAGLWSIDEAYQRNHRGGELGYYRFEKTGERRGEVECRNPYPCIMDRGIVRGAAKRYAPLNAFVFVEERGSTCRRRGDDACTFTVNW